MTKLLLDDTFTQSKILLLEVDATVMAMLINAYRMKITIGNLPVNVSTTQWVFHVASVFHSTTNINGSTLKEAKSTSVFNVTVTITPIVVTTMKMLPWQKLH